MIAASFLGGSTRLALEVDKLRVNVMLPSVADIPAVGESVCIDWKPEDMHLMEDGA